MSSSKRGGKSGGRKAGEPAGKKPAPGGRTSDARTPDGRTPPKRTSLPAFGFAADLLKSRKPAGEPASEAGPAKVPARRPAQPAAVPATGVPATGTPAADKQDPDRVFAFADSLRTDAGEEKAKKVRLETWVTLTLADETFALPVEPVREILRISAITRVPHAPYPIRGVTNLRGRVIPVIDLRIRLELAEGELTRASRIIVVSSRGRLLGLLVDGVHQVVHLDVDRVQPPPEDVMTIQSDYISGVYQMAEGLILLLDVERALVIREAAMPPATARGDLGAATQGAGA